jgi:hypothetical protein
VNARRRPNPLDDVLNELRSDIESGKYDDD